MKETATRNWGGKRSHGRHKVATQTNSARVQINTGSGSGLTQVLLSLSLRILFFKYKLDYKLESRYIVLYKTLEPSRGLEMKATIDRSALLGAIRIVQQVIPNRTPIEAYLRAKMIIADNRVVLMGTDTEVGIRYELQGVQIEEPGEALLQTDKLLSILREGGGGEVFIDADERRTKIILNRSEYELPAGDAAVFADISPLESTSYFEMAAGDLQRMIHRTIFAVSKEEGKYAMRGVLWDTEGNLAKLVATDSRRLALCTGNMIVQGMDTSQGQSYLIPPKALMLLDKLLGTSDASQHVQISMRSNEALFRTETAVITCRLIEGRFPPYRDVIPKKHTARIPLSVQDFLSAVKQASIMSDEESRRIRMRFTSGELLLDAQGSNTGKSDVSMNLDYTGPEISINFDPTFIIDFLRVLDTSESLELDLVDGLKSAVFRVGEECLYLVVPLT